MEELHPGCSGFQYTQLVAFQQFRAFQCSELIAPQQQFCCTATQLQFGGKQHGATG